MTTHYGGDGSHFTSEPDDFVGESVQIQDETLRFLDSEEFDAWLDCRDMFAPADLHFEDWVDHGGEA